MIQLRDVHVTLSSAAGPVKILRGVSLDVDEGSSVSVVGPSGSGKSTLLAVIGGIERPTAGTVRIDGRDLGDLDEDELASFRGRQIGILFQAVPPDPDHDRARERRRAAGAGGGPRCLRSG